MGYQEFWAEQDKYNAKKEARVSVWTGWTSWYSLLVANSSNEFTMGLSLSSAKKWGETATVKAEKDNRHQNPYANSQPNGE